MLNFLYLSLSKGSPQSCILWLEITAHTLTETYQAITPTLNEEKKPPAPADKKRPQMR